MLDPYIEAGFERFPKMPHELCSDVAAKTIYVNGRRAFTIVVKYYDYAADGISHEGVSADTQYNVHADDKPVFNVELLHAESPEQVVQFFTDIWVRMECGYYD